MFGNISREDTISVVAAAQVYLRYLRRLLDEAVSSYETPMFKASHASSIVKSTDCAATFTSLFKKETGDHWPCNQDMIDRVSNL